MWTQLPYILQVQVIVTLCWGFYRLVLQRGTHFGFSRAYLLLSVPLAFALPLLHIPLWPGEVVTLHPLQREYLGTWEPAVLPAAPAIDPRWWFYGAALAGSLVLAAVGLYHTAGYLRMLFGRKHAITRVGPVRVVYTPAVETACSLFGSVFFNDRGLDGREQAQVLRHEMAHVRLRHSWDRLLAETVRIVLWWNPVVWLWHRSLCEVHEFQADRAVLEGDPRAEAYIRLMMRCGDGYGPALASGFGYSLLRRRLRMIAAEPSRGGAWRKGLLVMPLLVLLLSLFSFTRGERVYVMADETVSAPPARETAAPGKIIVNGIPITREPRPVILLDGREPLDTQALARIDPQTIEQVTVTKDSLHGTRASLVSKPDFVETGKPLTSGWAWSPVSGTTPFGEETVVVARRHRHAPGTPILWESVVVLLDGKKVDQSILDTLNPQRVESIRVLKGEGTSEDRIEITTNYASSRADDLRSVVTPFAEELGAIVRKNQPSAAELAEAARKHQLSAEELAAVVRKHQPSTEEIVAAAWKNRLSAAELAAMARKNQASAEEVAAVARKNQIAQARTVLGKPVVLLDGKKVDEKVFDTLNMQWVESMSVLNDKSAPGGRIKITTKKTYPASSALSQGVPVKGSPAVTASAASQPDRIVVRDGTPQNTAAVILLDGREISSQEFGQLDPRTIDGMMIVKDENAPGGRIEITTKKSPAKPEEVTIRTRDNKIELIWDKATGSAGTVVFANPVTGRFDISPLSGDMNILLDGREISEKELEQLDPQSIESCAVDQASRLMIVTSRGAFSGEKPQMVFDPARGIEGIRIGGKDIRRIENLQFRINGRTASRREAFALPADAITGVGFHWMGQSRSLLFITTRRRAEAVAPQPKSLASVGMLPVTVDATLARDTAALNSLLNRLRAWAFSKEEERKRNP